MNTSSKESGALELILVAVVLVAAIGGLGYYVYKSNTDKQQDSVAQVATSASAESLPIDLSAIKTIDEITALAQTDVGDATIAGIELEQNDGATVYKVKLSDKRVLRFDATTGAMLGVDVSAGDDLTAGNVLPPTFTTKLTAAQARQVALNEKPNGVVSKIEIELEEGVVVYSVRFTDKSRIDVDVASGAIVRQKQSSQSTIDSTGSSNSGSSNSGSSNSGSGSSNSGSGRSTTRSSDDSSTTPAPATAGGISEADARSIALDRLPGKTVEKVELELEEGVNVYSVRFTDKSRVDVRQSDGAVVRVDS